MNKILQILIFTFTISVSSQDFQGQAFYKTQTSMDFGSWGDRMSAEQKKAMKDRMKPFLEPVYGHLQKFLQIQRENQRGNKNRNFSCKLVANNWPKIRH